MASIQRIRKDWQRVAKRWEYRGTSVMGLVHKNRTGQPRA
jgi:hypothetical protein